MRYKITMARPEGIDPPSGLKPTARYKYIARAREALLAELRDTIAQGFKLDDPVTRAVVLNSAALAEPGDKFRLHSLVRDKRWLDHWIEEVE